MKVTPSALQERAAAIPPTQEMLTWVHLGDAFRTHLTPWSTRGWALNNASCEVGPNNHTK